MEDAEQDYEEDRNTPDFVSEDSVRFVRLGHLELFFAFVRERGSKMLGNVLVSRVRNERLEVGPENVVGERLFELVHHTDGFFVHFHFDFVALDEFYRVEKRIFDLNDMQQLSVQRQKNSAKRACNTLLATMKQT